MAGRLAGNVAVITGGASGMGRATVEKFATERAREDAAMFVSTDVCRETSIRTVFGVDDQPFDMVYHERT